MWGCPLLTEIKIADYGTYSPKGELLTGCKPINFIFGTNGSGKTTISRVIANPEKYPACQLSWKHGRVEERLVFNSDFITENFKSSMRGIFTLGKSTAEADTEIERLKGVRSALQAEIALKRAVLMGEDGTGGKTVELERLRSEFEDRCWKRIKVPHDPHFQDVFDGGIRNAKSKFADRVVEEWTKKAATSPKPIDELKNRANTLFQKGLGRLDALPTFDVSQIATAESSDILLKKVIGNQDVDVAGLILRLGNSDWVRNGLPFLNQSGAQCPFCQQALLNNISESLVEFFDEQYIADMAAIDRLQDAYTTYTNAAVDYFERIVAVESVHLDSDKMRHDLERLKQHFELNARQIDRKRTEPSTPIILENSELLLVATSFHIATANAAIAAHNDMVDNVVRERRLLITEAWHFLLDESSDLITTFNIAARALQAAIDGLRRGITDKGVELASASNSIALLEKERTSVQPTVDEINRILRSFGFSNFLLAPANDEQKSYKIIREDGGDAATTLSEGEKSFVTFLYFYHLLRGSLSEAGANTDRVVVFDDPVSSLDSDVLFIVSALIKKILADACAGVGQIKQVFILTHNIYFHKEVSFDAKRDANVCRNHETFWIVKKKQGKSVIISYPNNPIKSSYELLWSEVKAAENSKMTIQNTLRRIIENYFKILGNIDRDATIAKFDGREQQICGSLFSWVNDGSHSVHDDLHMSADEELVDRYLSVFKEIFIRSGHGSHYNMMMGLSLEGPELRLPIAA